MSDPRFDLVVIGSGPAGQKGAIAAAKAGKSVAVVDGEDMLGGVCLHTGTIPSKTLREAVMYLTGFRQRSFYGADARVKQSIRVEDLKFRVDEVVRRQQAVVQDQLTRNGIEMIAGTASFVDPHTIEIRRGEARRSVHADHLLIACGTRPARREDLPFDHPGVRDADQILSRVEGKIAGSTIVIGGGVIGLEYAAMMVALEIDVTIVEARDELLGFVDREIIQHFVEYLEAHGAKLLMGESVERISPESDRRVSVYLESGKQVTADAVLYAVGRQPNTDRLNLEAIGLPVDSRGRIQVDARFRTEIPHVYAAGDVIGFPSLASTSMEQGRVAASDMFRVSYRHYPELLPYGVYTIPEIAVVGKTERDLQKSGAFYAVGRSMFGELARAQIAGQRHGMLKIVFDAETLELLGVHVIGEGAAELVHIGLAAMMAKGSVEDLRDIVFNYPTMAEAYKVAALDGLNRLD